MIVHLVDGTYELFRHFYGNPARHENGDRPLGAVAGVLRTVAQMLEGGATHIGVATDHVIESFRNELWPGYKTGEGIESALLVAVPSAGRSTRRNGQSRPGRWSSSRPMTRSRRRRGLRRRTSASRRCASGRPTRICRSACRESSGAGRSAKRTDSRRAGRDTRSSASPRHSSPTTSRWSAMRRRVSGNHRFGPEDGRHTNRAPRSHRAVSCAT